eukprot:GHRR01027540.1.p1 GENE.GHRR01027540.1~~GHRR01027540.1.p1  ORF type:complete len:987 (+),score=414.93 GHRR01027540.1:174-3134(+)
MQSSGQPSQQPPLQESDIPQLLQLLHGALSPDAAVQKHAESILASIASRTGYCSCLAAIVGNQGADHSARWLAAVQLKNSVNKYWRPRYDTGGLSHQEKAYLRGHFLQLIPQDDNQIAVQVALVIAKAARFDFPQQWPNLFIDLLAGIAVAPAAGGTPAPPSILLLRRTYVVLHHVLKELSSKRLAADQKAFADVAQLLFEHVWSSWGSLLQDILTRLPAELAAPAGSAPPQALLLAFERWLLLLKILRRLLLFGFRSDAKSLQPVPAVALVAPQLLAAMAALHQVQQQQQQSQQQRGQHSSAAVSHRQLSAMVERGMLKLIKTLSQVQQEHPWSFHHAGVLLSLLEACYTQLLAAAGQGPWSPAREALLLTCCQAVLAVLRCDSYAGRLSSNTAGAHTQQASTIKRMAGEVSGQLATWWGAPAQPPQLPALAAALAAAGSGPQQQQPQQQQADGQHTRQSALLVALIAGFFPLTHRDIDEWLDDGEQWALANADTASNLHGLKSCCHQLALSLLLANKASLAPVLVQLLQGVSACVPEGWGRGAAAAWPAIPGPPVPGPSGAANPAVLLLKEAVYEAVGLAAYELHDYIDYPGWLRGSLLPEMMAVGNQQHHQQADGSSSKHKLLLLVLPRAAARLVGHWVADLKATDRPAVYRALTVLLVQPSSADKQQQHKPDVVLQLAAVSAMRIIVDDFGFESEGFVEVLPAVMQALTGMLATSQELDTQTQVFGLMNLIIDRLGPDIKPHVGTVMPLLPQTWLAAADQSLLRIQALCCLSLLVNVLGPDSPALYPVLLPMLRESLHPDSHQPELLEDGLACWLVALRNAPGAAGDPQGPAIALLELTPALVSCLALSTEHIAMGMQLFTSLLLLGGAPFLATYGSQLMSACTAYVGEVVERGLLLMLPPVDLLLVAAPEQAAFVVLPFMQVGVQHTGGCRTLTDLPNVCPSACKLGKCLLCGNPYGPKTHPALRVSCLQVFVCLLLTVPC